ncbi:MAG: nucleotide exchange factor GrpE [Oscillospiraceae bacterium]|jgi:molecular chaperone GrpE|nr:nucleotide exchange factor GrpE [Oscillospiraceae bacterium]
MRDPETNLEEIVESSEDFIENGTVEEQKEGSEVEILKSEIETLRSELESVKNNLIRIAAEYENYRKRSEKEKSLIYSDATGFAVLSILPVIDNLELAFKSLKSAPNEYKKGIEMVQRQLINALEKLNISSFGTKGEEFDPNLHSAVSQLENEGGDKQIISEVFQKGYRIENKVIRHATVQVSS